MEKTGHFYQSAKKLQKTGMVDEIEIEIIHLMKQPNEDVIELMAKTKQQQDFLGWFYPQTNPQEEWKEWKRKNDN